MTKAAPAKRPPGFANLAAAIAAILARSSGSGGTGRPPMEAAATTGDLTYTMPSWRSDHGRHYLHHQADHRLNLRTSRRRAHRDLIVKSRQKRRGYKIQRQLAKRPP